MYPLEELEDELVSASQQTIDVAKPPVMESTSISINISSRKPPELRQSSVSPSSSSSNSNSSVMGKVERPAIKIYATLMVPTTHIFYVYTPLLVGTLQSS